MNTLALLFLFGCGLAAAVPLPAGEVAPVQEYPEAAYEEGSEVDYETEVKVGLEELLSHTVNIEAPSPFGQGVNGDDGPNSVVQHIADLPAGIPFEGDFETDVNVDVADSKIHTLNVRVKPHDKF